MSSGGCRPRPSPWPLPSRPRLLGFGSVVVAVGATLEPHRLAFYESCPVLRAEGDDIRLSRLSLARVTSVTLEQGLALLRIATPEQM